MLVFSWTDGGEFLVFFRWKYDKSTVEFLTVVAWFINVFKKYKISRLELDLKIFQIIFRSEKEKLGKFFDKIKVSRFKRY